MGLGMWGQGRARLSRSARPDPVLSRSPSSPDEIVLLTPRASSHARDDGSFFAEEEFHHRKPARYGRRWTSRLCWHQKTSLSGVRLLALLLGFCCAAILLPYLHHQYVNRQWIRRQWYRSDFAQPPFPLIGDTHSAKLPSLLLVTCFYPLKASKHSNGQYTEWLHAFLAQVESPMYIYTTPDMAPMLRAARPPHLPPVTINTTYTSALGDMPPYRAPHVQASYRREQVRLDPEGFRHSGELYAIWNAKLFMTEAATLLPEPAARYDLYLWVDIGTFRDGQTYRRWPDPKAVQRLFDEGAYWSGRPQEDLILQPSVLNLEPIYRTWTLRDGPLPQDFLMGGFFCGSASAIQWYSQTFYRWHDRWLEEGLFVGKDQSLFNAIAVGYPDRFISHDPMERGLLCENRWWLWQYLIANPQEREEATTVHHWRIPFAWLRALLACRPLPTYSMRAIISNHVF